MQTLAPTSPAALSYASEMEAIVATKEFPPVQVIKDTWLSVKDVADMHDMTEAGVTRLCREDKLWAINLGQWYIEPESARSYVRGAGGRPTSK